MFELRWRPAQYVLVRVSLHVLLTIVTSASSIQDNLLQARTVSIDVIIFTSSGSALILNTTSQSTRRLLCLAVPPT